MHHLTAYRSLLTDSGATLLDEVPIPRPSVEVRSALSRWHLPLGEATAAYLESLVRYPDDYEPESYWNTAPSDDFLSFFTWGHDHEFASGISRTGAMRTRHLEIADEAVAVGFLPTNLRGQRVLDVGCWTGGDALILAGLGAEVTAIDEHPRSCAAVRWLSDRVGADLDVQHQSMFDDREDWAGHFDMVYASGVIYHVSDPLLFLRTAFAYLNVGGRLIIESNAESGHTAARCGYSGSVVRGWNHYAPTATVIARWLVDAGFEHKTVQVFRRPIGRLIATARKTRTNSLPFPAGFSRPRSWLAGTV
jgi:2-polyprenyl-3-methyl-5-hydroxy-6-metoxy-1,4-benzoquinol methylase